MVSNLISVFGLIPHCLGLRRVAIKMNTVGSEFGSGNDHDLTYRNILSQDADLVGVSSHLSFIV